MQRNTVQKIPPEPEPEIVVVDGEVAEVTSETRKRLVARFSQVLGYLFGVVYGVIGLRFFLDLIGANPSAGFYQLISTLSLPLLGPFQGLVEASPLPGAGAIEFSYLIALVIYILLHLAVYHLMRLIVYRRVSV